MKFEIIDNRELDLAGKGYKCAESAIVNALLCIADALWAVVLGKIFGWW